MATVVIFPSVLGVRQGIVDAGERIRADGHDVHVVDLYEGRIFDIYADAINYAEQELGIPALMQRATDAVAGVPDGFVVAGFSMGCAMAMYIATTRRVSGVLMVAGSIPPSALETGATWPQSVPAQTHSTLDDPWREQDLLEKAIVEAEAGGVTMEVFDYQGSGHLFTDTTLEDEYDEATTELFWSRVLPFIRACG